MKAFLRIFFVVAVIIGLVYWFAGHKIYEFAILKILAIRAETIAPNREVVWEPGPVAAEVPASERPPNIIVILADDLGYNDLTFDGGGVANGAVPTPHIDSLAREGIKFAYGYANNATCSPSRAAIVTGRYATRFGFEFTPTPPQFAKVVHRLSPRTLYFEEREEDLVAYENMGVPAAEVTIAELLKKKGYHNRGWKMTFFEGGLHVPFFMKWPAGLPRGKTYDAPVSHFDIYATTAAAAGVPVPDDRTIDGVNLLPYLKAEKQGRPHDVLFWKSGHYKTVLAGDWKLQTAERPRKDWLYNLAEDPTEQVNLAQQEVQKVSELKSLLADHEKQLRKPAWPSLIEGLVTIDHPLNIPFREGDEFVYWAN